MPNGRRRSRRRTTSSDRRRRANRDGVVEIEISQGLDRHAVEALRLEIWHLAKRLGLEIKALEVETIEAVSA
jgi:hypothetical protein